MYVLCSILLYSNISIQERTTVLNMHKSIAIHELHIGSNEVPLWLLCWRHSCTILHVYMYSSYIYMYMYTKDTAYYTKIHIINGARTCIIIISHYMYLWICFQTFRDLAVRMLAVRGSKMMLISSTEKFIHMERCSCRNTL